MNQPTKPPRLGSALLLGLACLLVTGSGGCKALHPFAEHTKAKFDSARNWANGGLEALQSGHAHRALGFLKRAAEQRPDDFRNRANLARAHFQSGDFRSAAREMQQAVELSDNDPFMTIELGEMQLASGDSDAARKQAESVLGNDHQFVPAWILLGKISRYEGELNTAMVYLHKAAGFAPDNLDIPMELAKTYQANNEPLKALAAIDHLLNRHPIDAQPEQAILTKADILIQLDQSSTAISTLRKAIAERSSSEAIATKLVQTQINAGRTQQAHQSLSSLRQQFPESSDLRILAQQIDDLIVR